MCPTWQKARKGTNKTGRGLEFDNYTSYILK